MYETGIRPTGPFRKCSKVVGDVMGNYHPHGNDAIYGTLVRLGQNFSTRYPLIEPQGNFGTPDDPPAAMRYTESRMSSLSSQLLDGIDDRHNFLDFSCTETDSSIARKTCILRQQQFGSMYLEVTDIQDSAFKSKTYCVIRSLRLELTDVFLKQL